MYIISVIKKSIGLFNRRQKLSFLLLLMFFLLSALIQVVGIASIGPFIALLSNPSIIETNPTFNFIYKHFEFKSNLEFIISSAYISLFMMIFSNVISATTQWLLLRFSIIFGGEIQTRLFENMIFRPYLFHKISNYSESISTISQETPRFVYMVLQPILTLFSNIFVATIILAGLIALNPVVALSTGALLGFTYLITYIALKKSLSKHGKILTERNTTTQKILSEAFVGIKEVKLNALEQTFISKFKKINMKGLESSAYITLSGDIPKFIIETVSFSAIFLLAIFALRFGKDATSIVPIMSVYAIAGYKLLPTLQQVYKSISTLSAHGSVSFLMHNEFNSLLQKHDSAEQSTFSKIDSIRLENISFRYPNSPNNALTTINLTFNNNMLNTIAGHSGSGKSTLVDLLLGLLEPQSGRVIVNDIPLTSSNIKKLQYSAGYVPQQIFIIDDTVISNIAFGESVDKVDLGKIRLALSMANALEFVEKMPNGLNTVLGQDGKRLSGGQKQKIGIARSLYKNNKVLILDEPTSALDIESEYEFMMLLQKLKKDLLVIVISHRPSAIKCSDSITLIDNGHVEAHGSFEHLKQTNAQFQSMLTKSVIE